jgi:hypothetical protein
MLSIFRLLTKKLFYFMLVIFEKSITSSNKSGSFLFDLAGDLFSFFTPTFLGDLVCDDESFHWRFIFAFTFGMNNFIYPKGKPSSPYIFYPSRFTLKASIDSMRLVSFLIFLTSFSLFVEIFSENYLFYMIDCLRFLAL